MKKRLSSCCNAEIYCNTHNKRNISGVKKTWICTKCKQDASIPRDQVIAPPAAIKKTKEKIVIEDPNTHEQLWIYWDDYRKEVENGDI